MIAGTGGDCGKTAISLGLTACWRNEGLAVAPFKKGPDYIDAAWLSLAAGRKARNLDVWMMGVEGVLRAFAANAIRGGINLVEGNRGLHDGEDARGTHSSAALARLLGLPVVLIVPATKVTRTAAAVALGMKLLDPGLKIAGVLLNRLATSRQETIARSAIEAETGLPVLGAVPRVESCVLPGRHMGLVTPQVTEWKAAGKSGEDYIFLLLPEYLLLHCDDAVRLEETRNLGSWYQRVRTANPLGFDPRPPDAYLDGGLARGACYEIWRRIGYPG